MYKASDFFQAFADAWPRWEYFIRVVGIHAPFFYRRNGFEIAPLSRRSAGVGAHTRLDNHLWSFGNHVLVRQSEPGLRCIAGNVLTAGKSDQLVKKVFSADSHQRSKS